MTFNDIRNFESWAMPGSSMVKEKIYRKNFILLSIVKTAASAKNAIIMNNMKDEIKIMLKKNNRKKQKTKTKQYGQNCYRYIHGKVKEMKKSLQIFL